MSADNGIYILISPIDNIFGQQQQEYRVAGCQAIDNLNWNGEVYDREYFNPQIIVAYFGQSPVFNILTTALEYAYSLARTYAWLEYGVCQFQVPRPFEYYMKQQAHIQVCNRKGGAF